MPIVHGQKWWMSLRIGLQIQAWPSCSCQTKWSKKLKNASPPSVPCESALVYQAWYNHLLQSDSKKSYLLVCIKDGLHIVDNNHCVKSNIEMKNHRSATCKQNKGKVESQIIDELARGQYKIVAEKNKNCVCSGCYPKKRFWKALHHSWLQLTSRTVTKWLRYL